MSFGDFGGLPPVTVRHLMGGRCPPFGFSSP